MSERLLGRKIKKERKISVDAAFRNIFEVRLDEDDAISRVIQFRIDLKDGSDARVSFDGGETWTDVVDAYHAIKAFEDRFPEAFGEI